MPLLIHIHAQGHKTKIMPNKKYPLGNAGEDGKKILLECCSSPVYTYKN